MSNNEPTGNNPPTVRSSCEYSPDFYQNIFKAIEPFNSFALGIEAGITDSQALLLESLRGQVALLQDLARNAGSNDLEIERSTIDGFSSNLSSQLNVLDVINNEFHLQARKAKKQYQSTLSTCENTIIDQAQTITALEREIAMLKGGVA